MHTTCNAEINTVCLGGGECLYLECGPLSHSFPACFDRQGAYKWSHALRVELTLLVHVHQVYLQEFTMQHATHAEVKP